MISVKLTDVIAPQFFDLHKQLKTQKISEVWAKGGRGSTKSTFISAEILLGLEKDKDASAIIFRRYDNELRDSVYGQMVWSATKLVIDSNYRMMVSPMQFIRGGTEQKILYRGADNPKKAKSFNIGKGYVKYVWFEEVDQFGGMEEIRNLLQSLFRGSDKQRIAFFSYNPPKSARSWVNQEVRIPKPGRIIHHSDYRTVPVDWVGERFIADAEHLREVNESAYRHEYLGEEIGTGLEVFNNITTRVITDDEVNSFQNIRQGLDFGYAVDPVCFLRMNYDQKKRRLYIFREVSGIGIGNRQLSGKITDQEKRTLTIADSAEPKSIDELKRDYGWNIRGARKAPGSVERGIKWLCELEEIIIDPTRCPLSAREFVNYALEVNRAGDVISRYPDKDNHSIDSTRYAAVDDVYSISSSTNVRAIAHI
jgi:PBSX family phage terminase large subunit